MAVQDEFDKLEVQRNEPLEAKDADNDAFNHVSYAQVINKLIIDNNPPLSIGLFGGWGIGKSSIINALMDIVLNQDKITPIHFNAWKYSGDSFRRELLLAIAEQIGASKEERHRLENLFHDSNERDSLAELSFWKQLWHIVTKDFFRFNPRGVAVGIVTFLFLLLYAFGHFFWVSKEDYNIFTLPLIGGLITYFLQRQFPNIIEYKQTDVIDPKLIFPEQFEREFKKLIDDNRGKKEILLIIDDFDRCHDDMIFDILTNVKTFFDNKYCYLLIALDDKAVINSLSKKNTKYQDESLRKYFDVTVKVSPLGKSDLVYFAKTMADKNNIPSAVIQVGVLAKCDDARKLKHFINAIKIKYNILKLRQEFLPSDFIIEEQLPSIAKLYVIEEQFPEIYSKIVRRPYLINKLEDYILHLKQDSECEKILRGKKGTDGTGNRELRRFLEATVDISIKHPEVYTLLNVPKFQYVVPRGNEWSNAIINKDTDLLNELAQYIESDEDRLNLVHMIMDEMLVISDAIFQKSIIGYCLHLIDGDLLNKAQKLFLAKKLNPFLNKQSLRDYPTDSVFSSAQLDEAHWEDKFAEKLKQESISNDAISPKLSEIINSFYKFDIFKQYHQKKYSAAFNAIIKKWIDANKELQSYLEVISNIKILTEDELKSGLLPIPSFELLRQLIETLDSDVELNYLRRAELFSRWNNEELRSSISAKIFELLEGLKTETTLSPMVKFVFETVIDMRSWIAKDNAKAVCDYCQQFYNQCPTEEGKVESVKVMLIGMHSMADGTASNPYLTFIVGQINSMSINALESICKLIERFGSKDESFVNYKRIIIKRILVNILGAGVSTTDDRMKELFEFCFKNKFDEEDYAPITTLMKTMYSSNALIVFWKETLLKYIPKMDEPFIEEVCDDLLNIMNTQTETDYLEAAAEVLISLLSELKSDKKLRFIPTFMNYIYHNDEDVRRLVSEYLPHIEGILEKSSNKDFFRNNISNVAKKLFKLTPDAIIDIQDAVTSLLEYKAVWTSDVNDDFADLIRWMLAPEYPKAIHDYARSLLNELEEVPNGQKNDITSSLISLAKSASDEEDSKETLTLLQDKNFASKLDKKSIMKYLDSISG